MIKYKTEISENNNNNIYVTKLANLRLINKYTIKKPSLIIIKSLEHFPHHSNIRYFPSKIKKMYE